MNTIIRILVAIALMLPTISQAEEAVPRTIIGVDLSGSSTFLFDQSSADAAGNYVERYIAGLSQPHELFMVSLGDPGMARRAIDIRATVTNRRNSGADVLARQFGGYFRSLPALAARGDLKEQGTTSLVAFFESLAPICAKGNATIIAFTDGWEWSSTIDGPSFASGAAMLPELHKPFLSGCRVEMLGVGQVRSTGSSDGLERRFTEQWQAFLQAAGADSISIAGEFFGF